VADDARRGSTGLHRTDPSDRVGTATLRRWRRRLADEREEARIYRDLATRRSGEDQEILLGLADAEERHAAHWSRLLGEEAGGVRRGSLRLRLLAFLARRFGSVFVLALAQRAETRSPYRTDRDATPSMAADERVHEEVVRGLAARGRARVSGTFRAAVFGANDGLVSNLSLVLGVTGGGASTSTVLLTGLAGLLSGALSMGAGEYVSVRSQRELLAASSPDVSDAHTVLPNLDLNANELALVYRARGLSPDEARARADEVLRSDDPARSVRPDPDAPDTDQANRHDVVGTGLGAAVSSFAFFASGAAVPVLPFLFGLEGTAAVILATVLVGLALLLTGATVGVLSGGSPLRRALRQLAIGAGAAAITYGLGLAFGATTG
jgi:vacuolar iron transporter family protein